MMQTNLSMKQKQTRTFREWTYSYQQGKGIWDWHAHTSLFKTENQQDLLYSTGSSAQYSVIISMGKEFEKE